MHAAVVDDGEPRAQMQTRAKDRVSGFQLHAYRLSLWYLDIFVCGKPLSGRGGFIGGVKQLWVGQDGGVDL